MSLKEKMAGMTLQEKAEYLWEYYKWVLLVAAFAVIVIAMVVTGIVNTSGEILYSGAAVNVPLSEEGKLYLTEDLETYFGAQKGQKAELFSTSFQDLNTASDVQTNAANAMQVALMIAAEDYDYVLMDKVALAFYINHPVFTPLDQLFDEAFLAEFEGSVIYSETEENGRYPIALEITQTALVRQCTEKVDSVYIAFPGNTGRIDKNEAFLKYILKME